MAVITFSRTFPAYHPKSGQPTGFIEKIYAGLADSSDGEFIIPNDANEFWDFHTYYNCTTPKHHTIRAGNRWKVGDKFSPRVWGTDINPKSGKSGPYQSKQIIIAPDITIAKIWDIKIEGWHIWINKEYFSVDYHNNQVAKLAENDGLSVRDFWDWFPCKPAEIFTGQIISWSDKIEY